ncbi:ComEC/Rec2 family competence protein [Candidatus Daviesbacteria bacterium]|nr:ComEC/Rec2 family competence protein [Candidatus Daviesbacteria bacterium]
MILAVVLYLLLYLLRLEQGGWEPKIDLFQSQRQMLDQRISQLLPSPQAEILSGILLGQNKNLPSGIKLAFRDTSTLHIVVASGQNLSLVAGFFLGFAGLIRRKNAIILSFITVSLYVLLTGFQVPIIRAAIMFTLASTAQFFGRQRDGIWVLMFTAGLMLLVNPLWISNLSFQLSFMATFGVIAIAPILLKYLKSVPILSQDLAVSLGAQLMVAPIIAQNFHQFSVVGLITNLLVLWTVSFIMILGTVTLFLSFFSSLLAQIVGIVTSVLLTYFIYIVQFFASMPFAWEYIGQQSWLVWIGYYMILAGGLMVLHKQNYKG